MTVGMIGADPQVLRQVASQFDAAAQQFMGSRSAVQVWVDRRDIWQGLDNHRFTDMWDTTGAVSVAGAATVLQRYAEILRANADAQDTASAADGAGIGGSGLFCAEPGGGSTTASRAAESPSELFGKLHAQDSDSADGIRIEKVLGPDGRERFVVYINGSGQGESGTFGLDEALLSQFGATTGTEDLVRKAMREAGVGSDSEVLYVGYSQGGMIAQNLAASQEFGAGVVLAQGSPRTSATQYGYDVIHINVFGDGVLTGVGLGGWVYDHGNGVMGLLDPRIGHDYVHTHFDTIAAREGSVHTNMGAYERATRSFEQSSDGGALESRARLEPFLGGTVVYDTK